MLSKPRIKLNTLKTNLRFLFLGHILIIDSINVKDYNFDIFLVFFYISTPVI